MCVHENIFVFIIVYKLVLRVLFVYVVKPASCFHVAGFIYVVVYVYKYLRVCLCMYEGYENICQTICVGIKYIMR